MPDTPVNGATVDDGRLPKEDLARAVRETPQLRAQDGDRALNANGMPTMTGHFAVFDTWTEIDSMFEGNFLERIARGAFKKTMRDMRDRVKVLFQHGMDPQIGDKVLGRADTINEDDEGAYYEVPLLDTSYNRDLLPALEAGLYGASFRFSVVRELVDSDPDPSEFNPRGIRERTIKEVRLHEFGPVTFPAYTEATAGIRSITDELILGRATSHPERLHQLIEYLEHRDRRPRARDTVRPPDNVPQPEASPPAPDEERPTGYDPPPPAEPDVLPSNHPEVSPPESTPPAPVVPPATSAPPEQRAEESPHPLYGRREPPYTLPVKENLSWRL